MTEKGIKGLVVTFDSFDEALVGEFQKVIQYILDDPWARHHDYKESLKDVDSFFRVLSWYMKPSEFKVYKESLKPLYDELVAKVYPTQTLNSEYEIAITHVRDLPDGDCIVEYEASPAMKEFLMGKGLEAILLKESARVLKEANVPGWDYFTEE